MSGKKTKKETVELTSLVTSSLARTSKLLSLSIRAGTGAALLSVKKLVTGEINAAQSQEFFLDQAKRLADELGKLKGSLQKAGQLFSIYGEHFLAPEINEILKSLQKDTPPVSWKVMHSASRRTLGEERLKRLKINPEPIGTASIGQVYQVTVDHDMKLWCLKLQYPGVDKSIDSDLKILKSIFNLLRFIPKDMNLDGLFGEIRTMLHREVDYLKEADATETFRSYLESDRRFVVPEVHREFTTRRAIVTSFEEGQDVDSKQVLSLSQERRNRLGEAILELFFKEFFILQTVQTDPHFGNYRIRISDDSEDQWVLLDFGAVRTFPKRFVESYVAIAKSVVFEANPQGLYEALRSLGIMKEGDKDRDIQAFYEISRLISEPFLTGDNYAWGRTNLAQRVAAKVRSILFDHGIRRPPEELLFLDRKIGGVFTILQKLDAVFAPRSLLEGYLSTYASKNRKS